MKFDLFSLLQQRDADTQPKSVYADMVEHTQLAEQAGFDTAWFAEHHFSNYSLCPSPLMAVSYMAPQTEKIRLGTATVVLPLYEPMRLVQEIGMADVLCDGRLVLGIGSGYQGYEFERFRVGLHESVQRTMEMLDLFEVALQEPSFSFDGEFYQIPKTQLAARTLNNRLPEIWVAGLINDDAVQTRLARSGYVPMIAGAWRPITGFAPVREQLDNVHASIGSDPHAAALGIMRFVHVTNKREEALDAAARARYSSRVSLSMRHGYARLNGIFVADLPAENEPTLEQMADNYIIGDAEHCIEKIVADWQTMRHSHLLCNIQLGGLPQHRVMHSLEQIGAIVLPGVEKELARLGVTEPVIGQQAPQYHHIAASS